MYLVHWIRSSPGKEESAIEEESKFELEHEPNSSSTDVISDKKKPVVSMIPGAAKAYHTVIEPADRNVKLVEHMVLVGAQELLSIHPDLHLPQLSSFKVRHSPPQILAEYEANDTALPPDKTLQNMTIIMQKRLKGVSVKDFYQACWSDDDESFYGSWLEQDNKLHVQVDDWQYGDFTGDWDHESYPQKRDICYTYKRDPGTLGYKLGKPQVVVTQTQYCRNFGEDRSVLAMTMSMDGEPWCDCFVVHIRGVATRADNDELLIDFGVSCQFVKRATFCAQIRHITETETARSMQDLFEHMKEACGAQEVERHVVYDEPSENESKQCCSACVGILSCCGRQAEPAKPALISSATDTPDTSVLEQYT